MKLESLHYECYEHSIVTINPLSHQINSDFIRLWNLNKSSHTFTYLVSKIYFCIDFTRGYLTKIDSPNYEMQADAYFNKFFAVLADAKS